MKLALIGYGKMGKAIEAEIQRMAEENQKKAPQIILKIDVNNAKDFTAKNLKNADVAIEFTSPETAYDNILKCFDAGIPVVVGTTGWYDKLEQVKKLCKEKNSCLFYASNFSIGVNVFFKLNEQLAKMMNNYSDYNISMEEIHHVHKLDAPSGTAISLANQIIENIKRKKKYVNTKTEKAEELEIISKRID